MKYPILLFIFSLFWIPEGESQETFSVKKNDSLIAPEGSSILSNNLYIQNKTEKTVTLNITVYSPEGWSIIGSKNQTIQIDSAKQEVIPISVFKMPGAVSKWESVKIAINSTQEDTPAFFTEFYVYTPPIRKFSIRSFSDNEDIELSKKDNEHPLRVKIINEGNIKDTYTILWRNDFLHINEKMSVVLEPGRDTVLSYLLKIKDNIDDFNMQSLSCIVKDESKNSKTIPFNLYTVTSKRTVNKSAFKTMKTNFSSGYMKFGNIAPSYYFGSNGFLNVDSQTYINYSYQSKQYNTLNQLQRDIFSVNAHHKNWDLNIGQMQFAQYFMSIGNGAKLSYANGKSKYALLGTKHYNNGFIPNDNAGFSMVNSIGKMKLENEIAIDHNTSTHQVAGILNNDLKLIDNKKVRLSISGGLGKGTNEALKNKGLLKQLSTSFGYAASYNTSFKMSIRSTLYKNSKNYPGIQGGLFRQFHEIRQQLNKKTAISAFYQYNSINRNYTRDSLYNSDAFTYNTERYGLSYSRYDRFSQFTISGGIMKQTKASGFVPHYDFLQLFYNYRKKDLSLSFSSINAIAPNLKDMDFISNTNLNFRYKYAGLTAIYTKVLNNNATDKDKMQYNETINLAPYIRFSVFKTLSASLNYNVSKLVNNDFIMQFAGGSINYNGFRNGLNFSVNASIPLKAYENNQYSSYYGLNYFTVTLSKSLNIPVSPKRKYADLRMTLFYDENYNGIKDDTENVATEMPVKINTIRFNTSEKGKVQYKNINAGRYKVEFDNNSLKEGYLPKNGNSQTIELTTRTKTIDIPIVKSKIIKGMIKIIYDSNSRKHITAEKMKIILYDSQGDFLQSTLANHKGEYFFNVPAGKYKVSLNEDAFNEEYKPETSYFIVNLTNTNTEVVNFLIMQKKRKMNIKKVTID